MGEDAEFWASVRERRKERQAANLADARAREIDGWRHHTTWHWSRDLCGDRLDYWPSRNRCRWRGQTYSVAASAISGFIRNREREEQQK